MIIHHSCGHYSRIEETISRDQMGTYRRLVCPACAAAAKVPVLPTNRWVQHRVITEPPIVQGPPSRQQLRAWKRRETWKGLKKVDLPRRERRKLLKEQAKI